MASANISSLSVSQLNCLLCLKKYQNPRTLPCLHSFCEECLGDYIVSNPSKYVGNSSEKVICPVCNEECSPPSRNVPINNWASSFACNDMFLSIMKLEDSSKNCDLCKVGDDEVNAEFWCPVCSDKLCAACLRFHSRSAALKDHKTVPIAEMDANSISILNYNRHCSCGRENVVDMFCIDHKQMLCSVCSNTKHRGCKEMRDLDRTGKEFSLENKAVNVMKDIEKIRKSLQQFEDIRNTNKSTVQSDIDKCNQDMDDMCNDTKQQIDTFQANFRQKATEIRAKYRKDQEIVQRFSTNAENSNRIFNVFKQYGDPKQILTVYDATISQLNSHYARLKTELRHEQDVRLSLEINNVFKELKETAVPFARLNTSLSKSTSANNFVVMIGGVLNTMVARTKISSSVCAAQIVRSEDVLSRGLTHVRSVTKPELTGGRQEVWFSGGTYVPNGHLVMADYYNERLVEFDKKHNMVKQYDLDGRPGDVTSHGHNVYVSVERGEKFFIYKCRLGGELTVVKDEAPKGTWGLAVSNCGSFMVLGTPFNVQVMSISEKHVHNIRTSGPYTYVAVPRTSTSIFCHTDRKEVVLRTLQDGERLCTYSHDNLMVPRGICTDDRGSLYVCCLYSGTVHHITPNGRRGRVLLDSVHGITTPLAVLYNPLADQLVVTSQFENTVMAVYKLR